MIIDQAVQQELAKNAKGIHEVVQQLTTQFEAAISHVAGGVNAMDNQRSLIV